jgi:MCP family monocarboxylic acid transporter-like MFS transporter 10
MMFLNGPIAAALAAKYGCRAVSMVGCVIFSVGFISSSYAQHIATLYFTYGLMVGFGASLCYFSSLVAVGQYFYSKLSLANGIISSGSGIGSLVMGPVMNNLLKYLGWRDTLRVYAGMAVLIFISAILYRPINSRVVQNDENNDVAAEEPRKAKFIDFTIFKNKAYIIWCVALSTFILGYFVPFVHLVSPIIFSGTTDILEIIVITGTQSCF